MLNARYISGEVCSTVGLLPKWLLTLFELSSLAPSLRSELLYPADYRLM